MPSRRVRHQKSDAIWLFHYPTFEAMDDCPELQVWLSQRDIQIILQATKDISRFQARVYNEVEGDVYYTVDDLEFEEFQGWVSDMFNNIGGYQMCNETMQGILAALQALVEKECCQSGGVGGGSAGAGTTAPNPSSQQTGEEEREGDPPAGFASWEDYDNYACKMAAKIIDDIIVDLAQGGLLAAGIVSVQTLAPILVGAFFTPVPFDEILVVAFLMIQILTIAISISELTSLLEDNKDDLVCEILSGVDVESSIAAFTAKVVELCEEDGEISGFGTLGIKAASDLINSFATVGSFNRIYEKVAYELPEYECDCGGPVLAFVTSAFCEATVISGEFVSGEEVTIESCVSSSEILGAIRHQVAIQTIDYPANATLEIVSISAGDYIVSWNDGSTPQTPETYGSAAATAGWTNSASALQVSRWTVDVATVPFTVTLRVTAL